MSARGGACALLAAALACEPQLQNGAAVRQTLAMQQQAPLPGPLRASADAAARSLQGWRSREGVELWLALREAQGKLEQAAANGGAGDDVRFASARDAFAAAAGRLAGASEPLPGPALDEVRALLARSRADAVAVRAQDPTAVSPVTSLRALRKHEEADTHYGY